MKRLSFFLLLALLTGCGIPTSIYHGVRVSGKRGAAVNIDEIASHVRIHDQRLTGFSSSAFERVVVFARLPGEAEPGYRAASGPGQPAADRLPASSRHIVESVFIQRLLAKGYRGASRMNLKPTEIEQSFPYGRGARETLANLFKGQRILIVTVNEFSMTPKEYSRDSVWSNSPKRYPIGSQMVAQITADLIDADTSESRWVATASIDTLVASSSSAAPALEAMIEQVADRIPTADSAALSQR